MPQSWRTDRRKTAERGYGARWRRERGAYLRLNPLCRMCLEQVPQRITPGTTVDHRIPHRGDMVLFWDKSNWQTLCTPHHSGDKQAIEKSGRAPRRIGPDGYPADAPTSGVEAGGYDEVFLPRRP